MELNSLISYHLHVLENPFIELTSNGYNRIGFRTLRKISHCNFAHFGKNLFFVLHFLLDFFNKGIFLAIVIHGIIPVILVPFFFLLLHFNIDFFFFLNHFRLLLRLLIVIWLFFFFSSCSFHGSFPELFDHIDDILGVYLIIIY